jgi:hypothetical protein
MDQMATRERLIRIEQRFMMAMTQLALGIREGEVMTQGPTPYRRLDCDGRALVYVRQRPRKDLVRVDVSGLWLAPATSSLQIPGAIGAASLALRTEEDCDKAVEFVRKAVGKTRAERARREAQAIARHEARFPATVAAVATAAAVLQVKPREPGDDGETPTDWAA